MSKLKERIKALSKPKNLMYIGSQIAIFVGLFFVMSTVMDFVRAPKPSVQALQRDYQTVTGKTVSFASQSERVKLVYVWGSWCGVCAQVSPAVNALYQDGHDVMTIALSSGDNADITAYVNKKGYGFPVVNDDDGKISESLQVGAVPVIFLVKEGRIIYSMTGFHPSFDIRLRMWLANMLVLN